MATHLPVIANGEGSLRADGKRLAPVPADVHGRFHRARLATFAALGLVLAALPWVRVGGAPAVFLDVAARRFYLFGLTANAQDLWLVFFVLSGIGFALLVVTALLGRAFCGWACPQTVFLDGLFRPVERLFEGPREARLRRDGGPWTLERVARKVAKHAVFATLALGLAHVILAYFVSLPQVVAMVRAAPAAHPEAFVWVVAITTLVYADLAFFREQLCLIVCPYGRLQSVLIDDRSLVVGYDANRGEPRGKKGAAGAGDCVDCRRCVVVCPTGIDIRNGLQLDCVACTACIDACDDVMDRLHRPRGLVRYDSTAGLEGRPSPVLRPRLAIYAALGLAGATVATFAFASRRDVEASLGRAPGPPYVLDGDEVRDVFDLHLVNKRNAAGHLAIEVDAPTLRAIVPTPIVDVPALGSAHVPIVVTSPRAGYAGDVPIVVRVRRDGALVATATGSFLGSR